MRHGLCRGAGNRNTAEGNKRRRDASEGALAPIRCARARPSFVVVIPRCCVRIQQAGPCGHSTSSQLYGSPTAHGKSLSTYRQWPCLAATQIHCPIMKLSAGHIRTETRERKITNNMMVVPRAKRAAIVGDMTQCEEALTVPCMPLQSKSSPVLIVQLCRCQRSGMIEQLSEGDFGIDISGK